MEYFNKNEHAPMTFLANSTGMGIPGFSVEVFAWLMRIKLIMTTIVDDPEINEIFAKVVNKQTDPVEANKIMKGLNQLWLAKAYYGLCTISNGNHGLLAMGGELGRRSQ